MSRTGAVTASSAAVLAVAGAVSGRLVDEHGGAAGALEWLLRTVVVAAAVVTIAGGVVLAARVRRRVRPRALGWAAAAVATVAFVWLAAIPVGYAVYLTHLPSRRAVHDADLGAPKERVAVKGADGVTLRGWYVPSRNGAAVIALHGTGSNRLGVADHARLLARHGYGVLALDLRGHGESGGRSMSVPWKLDRDLDGAIAWLARRPDVDRGRVGALGVSLGGEVAIRLAARRLLLISSGTAAEAALNRALARRGGPATSLWNLPRAAHGSALATDPAGYERRVIGFFDRAFRPGLTRRA